MGGEAVNMSETIILASHLHSIECFNVNGDSIFILIGRGGGSTYLPLLLP